MLKDKHEELEGQEVSPQTEDSSEFETSVYVLQVMVHFINGRTFHNID